MNWLGVFNVFGAIAGFFKWITGYEQRKAGATKAALDSLIRETERANQRAGIDDKVAAATRDSMEDELRGKP